MRRFILIRHSAVNVRPELPSETWQLSVEGQELAGLLAEDLAVMGITAVWSSTEPKAIETAQIISRTNRLRREADSRFNEQHRANAPFLGADGFRTAIAAALTDPNEIHFGEETVAAAVRRFRNGLRAVDAESPDGNVAIVSHGTVIAGYLGDEMGVDPVPIWQQLGLPGYMVINWPAPAGIEAQRNFDG